MHRLVPGIILAGVASGVNGAAIDSRQQAFAHPRQLVDIGGRRLNLYCSGAGPVTVVFDAPSSEAGWSWHAVQPGGAKGTRACVCDRAGLGFSDPSPLPGTSSNAVADLHALLAKAGIAPPYVMVGSSYGAGSVQLYVYRYPGEVKGLVLVDAPHDDETDRLDKVSQGKLKKAMSPMDAFMRQCAQPGQSALNKATEAEHLAMQKELAAYSTRSIVRVVPGAGHVIQDFKPAAVVQAVNEVLGQLGR